MRGGAFTDVKHRVRNRKHQGNPTKGEALACHLLLSKDGPATRRVKLLSRITSQTSFTSNYLISPPTPLPKVKSVSDRA